MGLSGELLWLQPLLGSSNLEPPRSLQKRKALASAVIERVFDRAEQMLAKRQRRAAHQADPLRARLSEVDALIAADVPLAHQPLRKLVDGPIAY